MNSTGVGVMARLKQSTREYHEVAENHAFQKALAGGTLPREAYVRYLGQMLLVHSTLEQRLRRHESDPAWAAVVRHDRFKEPNLRHDLSYFGVNPAEVPPVPATNRLVADLRSLGDDAAGRLLGYFYVLEGSTNGSRFIAKRLRQCYGLTGNDGVSYLDPYGDAQRQNWEEFRRNMDAVEFEESQIAQLLDGAREMFGAITAISSDLLTYHPTNPSAQPSASTPRCPVNH